MGGWHAMHCSRAHQFQRRGRLCAPTVLRRSYRAPGVAVEELEAVLHVLPKVVDLLELVQFDVLKLLKFELLPVENLVAELPPVQNLMQDVSPLLISNRHCS